MRHLNSLLWLAFAAFVAGALYFGWHDHMFTGGPRLGAFKLAIWVAFVGFVAYSAYCSSRENLFDTVDFDQIVARCFS